MNLANSINQKIYLHRNSMTCIF